jgi:uncharacterized protein YkwD
MEYAYIHTHITNGTLNRTTILLVLLIVTSLFLPATAIMYASGSPENSTAPPSGFTENNALPPEDSGIVSPPGEQPSTPPGEEIAPPSGFTENNAAPPSGFTENNAAPPSGFTENNAAPPSGPTGTNDALNPLSSGSRIEDNNTGNVTQSANIAESILTAHNQERALVGVQPLTWSDKLAASAQTWANQIEATGQFAHSTCCGAFRDYGENIAGISGTTSIAEIADGAALWVAEKNNYHGGPFDLAAQTSAQNSGNSGSVYGHYTQMVWRTTTEVGCATASQSGLQFAVLVCQYAPPGNIDGQLPY